MDVRLLAEGADPVGGLEELASWLGREPELRGRVGPELAAPAAGELGAAAEVLVAALGSGGAVSALAVSLRGFLSRPRRSDVRVIVEGPDGRRVTLDARRVGDVESLVRQVLGCRE
jgi:membrane-associated two-gene conflict system component 1 (EACC1)